MNTESITHFVAPFIAVIVFIMIGYIGFKTNVLKEPGGKYSFRNFQLWLWTLVICPLFAIYWGAHPDAEKLINLTSIILLAIPIGAKLTGDVISANQVNQKNTADPTKLASMPQILKVQDSSKGFFIDILSDDYGQISIARVQNFIFTIIYVVIYITYFFTNGKEYINWEKDSTAFVLMGISTSGYVLGKANFK